MYKYVFRVISTGKVVSGVDDAFPMSYPEVIATIELLESEHGEGNIEWECVSHPNMNVIMMVEG